jgi:RNA-directed DNA polymerase
VNVQKHYHQIADTVRNNKAVNQSILIGLLNPIITGWCNYYSTVVSKKIYSKLDHLTYSILRRWTKRRHPKKGKRWVKNKYFKTMENRNWAFSDGKQTLKEHSKTPITRHTKVKGIKSPYDGDTVYWGKRLSKSLELTTRQQKLLKSQKGICPICQSYFKTGDLLEVDHIIPRCKGGKDTYNNLQLLHAHCHDKKTASDGSNTQSTYEKGQVIEERSEVESLMLRSEDE